VVACPLDHRVTSYGYRIQEPVRRHFDAEALAAAGVVGPAVGRLAREGWVDVGGRVVRVEDVSEPRRGQSVAVVMDTRWCDSALELAASVDLLVAESTFLSTEADLAHRYGHLTAAQAGRLASEAGARALVLTHFSQRYPDQQSFADEAADWFDGPIHAAADFDRVPVPPRT
ncbi:MAG: hypothetical protein KDB21_03575, partial [Acidimicrobiales bacterium]|nr:hypothetical protein [Acidimicrobiales bacterium]